MGIAGRSYMLVALVISAIAAGLQAMEANAADSELRVAMRAVNDRCRTESQDRSFDVIRGKIALYGANPTAEMLVLNRKPTPTELSAIRLLYQLNLRCSMQLAKATKFGTDLESPLQLNEFAQSDLFALSLLMTGNITFAQYSVAEKERTETVLREGEKTLQQLQEAQRAQASPTLLLSCVAEAPDKFRGFEFQYRVDTRAGTVYPSRGIGVPSNVHISESNIAFTQDESSVAISRITGLFTNIVAGTSTPITGRCIKATTAAF